MHQQYCAKSNPGYKHWRHFARPVANVFSHDRCDRYGASGQCVANPDPAAFIRRYRRGGERRGVGPRRHQHLFRSLDRGATWEERDVPQLPLGPMKNISFVDDRDGWLLTVGSPATGCMAQGFTVWRTTDGASTWERAHQATFSSSPLAGGCKSRVAFVDPQHGYIDVAGRDVPPAVLRTSDGGTTWTLSQRLPDPPGFVFEPSISTLQPGALGDFGSVVLVSAGSFVNGTAQRHIFRSTDHGATWSYIRTAPSDADIVFLTPTRWLQVVPGSSSVETTDAGASWHAFATDYSQAAAVAPQIVFGDSTTGYASVRGTLQRTTDAGAHWTSLTTPGT